MKKCPNCNIKVNTDRITCPLCYTVLENIEEKAIVQFYPKKQESSKRTIIEKIFILITILGIIGSLIGNLITYKHGLKLYWVFVVIGGLIYSWVLTKYCVLGKGLLTNRLVIQAILSVILLVLIEQFALNKHGYWWSTNYVIPLLWSIVLLTILTLTFIWKNIFIDSIIGLLVMSLLGFIPIILFLTTSVITLFWPSITCCCISILVICTMLVFHFNECKLELQKRFHI